MKGAHVIYTKLLAKLEQKAVCNAQAPKKLSSTIAQAMIIKSDILKLLSWFLFLFIAIFIPT
jgi:hypothetical protein